MGDEEEVHGVLIGINPPVCCPSFEAVKNRSGGITIDDCCRCWDSMADECDEQTTALIAQLLAEDNDYAEADYYGEDCFEEGSDAEFDGCSKRKKAKKGRVDGPTSGLLEDLPMPIRCLVMHLPGTCSCPTSTGEEK